MELPPIERIAKMLYVEDYGQTKVDFPGYGETDVHEVFVNELHISEEELRARIEDLKKIGLKQELLEYDKNRLEIIECSSREVKDKSPGYIEKYVVLRRGGYAFEEAEFNSGKIRKKLDQEEVGHYIKSYCMKLCERDDHETKGHPEYLYETYRNSAGAEIVIIYLRPEMFGYIVPQTSIDKSIAEHLYV